MLIQIINIWIALQNVTYIVMHPDDINTERVEIHFSGGEVLDLNTPEQVREYKKAMSALRFGAGQPIPNGLR